MVLIKALSKPELLETRQDKRLPSSILRLGSQPIKLSKTYKDTDSKAVTRALTSGYPKTTVDLSKKEMDLLVQ